MSTIIRDPTPQIPPLNSPDLVVNALPSLSVRCSSSSTSDALQIGVPKIRAIRRVRPKFKSKNNIDVDGVVHGRSKIAVAMCR
jgi:hypothetical protein